MRNFAKKTYHIIGKIVNKYWKTYHKFGFRVPNIVDEVLHIDRETGTEFWRRSIKKETLNVRCKFLENKD